MSDFTIYSDDVGKVRRLMAERELLLEPFAGKFV